MKFHSVEFSAFGTTAFLREVWVWEWLQFQIFGLGRLSLQLLYWMEILFHFPEAHTITADSND